MSEPLRASSDTIVTARLELRLLTVEDAPHFVRLFENDWEAVKQTGRMPYPVTEAAMRDWIALHAVGSSMTFLMIRKEDALPMGGVGFGGVGDMQELGYALGRAYWGQGYATEGVLAMLEHARGRSVCGLWKPSPSSRIPHLPGFWPRRDSSTWVWCVALTPSAAACAK